MEPNDQPPDRPGLRILHGSGIMAAAATGLAAAMVWTDGFLLLATLTLGLLACAVVRAPRKGRALGWVAAALAAGPLVALGTWLVQAVAEMPLDP